MLCQWLLYSFITSYFTVKPPWPLFLNGWNCGLHMNAHISWNACMIQYLFYWFEGLIFLVFASRIAYKRQKNRNVRRKGVIKSATSQTKPELYTGVTYRVVCLVVYVWVGDGRLWVLIRQVKAKVFYERLPPLPPCSNWMTTGKVVPMVSLLKNGLCGVQVCTYL